MPSEGSLTMKILLVGPDYEENLSLRYLSGSLLSAGHDPVLAAFNSPIDTGAVANGRSGCGSGRAIHLFSSQSKGVPRSGATKSRRAIQ